ncbi:MAG: C39 family peptidase [Eubacteriales bacterium]|nr:C39 family peptidase [Eubacteriales bacterium]
MEPYGSETDNKATVRQSGVSNSNSHAASSQKAESGNSEINGGTSTDNSSSAMATGITTIVKETDTAAGASATGTTGQTEAGAMVHETESITATEPTQEKQMSIEEIIMQYGTDMGHDPLARLDIPFFRQIWEPWGKQPYAYMQSPVEMSGCALTSLSMLLKYYGVDTDPGELNQWLKNNGGYVGQGAIVWSVAAGRAAGLDFLGTISYSGNADLALIKKILDRGFPVLAEMNYKGTSHYVLLSGYNSETFYINDPWYENPGHTMNTTAIQGDLEVAYDNAGNPSAAIRSIVLFAYKGQVKPRTKVFEVKSNLPDLPEGWLSPLELEEITFISGSRTMIIAGETREMSGSDGAVPEIKDGRLMIPLKIFAGELGGKAEFDAQTNRMLAVVQGRHIECWPGIRTAYNNRWFFDWMIPAKAVGGDLLVTCDALAATAGCSFTFDAASGRGTFKPLK